MWRTDTLPSSARRSGIAYSRCLKASSAAPTDLPLARKIVCGDCHGLYGTKVWHSNSTTYRDRVWQCNNRIAGRTKCRCPHLYFTQLERATNAALVHLMGTYASTIDDCATLLERQDVLPIRIIKTLLQGFKAHPERLVFDNLALSILISKIIVTNKYNLVFYCLDGSTFRYS